MAPGELEGNAGAEAGGRSEPFVRAAKFISTLKNTEEEVYVKMIKAQAGFRSMTMSAWRSFLENLKNQPVGR